MSHLLYKADLYAVAHAVFYFVGWMATIGLYCCRDTEDDHGARQRTVCFLAGSFIAMMVWTGAIILCL